MPGHIGTFHFGARLAFETFGAGAVAAAAAALMVHALLWIPFTLAGGVWLLYAWGGAAAGRRLK